jgi:iron-sulfur cluster repair protein YtfE (RIC family)
MSSACIDHNDIYATMQLGVDISAMVKDHCPMEEMAHHVTSMCTLPPAPCNIFNLIVKTIQKHFARPYKRVEMNFCPESKNSIIGKTPRKLQDITELSTNYVTFTKFHR